MLDQDRGAEDDSAEPTIASRPSLVTTRAAPSSHGARRSSAMLEGLRVRGRARNFQVTAIVRATNTAMAARATTTSSHGMDARRTGIASRITPVLRTTRSVRDKRHRGVDSAPIGGSSRPGRSSRGRSPEQSPYGRPLRKRAAPRGPHGSRVVNSLSGLAAGSTWDDGICRGLLLGGVRALGLAAARCKSSLALRGLGVSISRYVVLRSGATRWVMSAMSCPGSMRRCAPSTATSLRSWSSCSFLLVGIVTAHPKQVELRADSLSGAPGAAM